MKIALITYNYPHLKTEQIVLGLKLVAPKDSYAIFTIPYDDTRKKRDVIISHRPDQYTGISPESVATAHNIPIFPCKKDTEIASGYDFYLILGAGLLSKEFIFNKKVINCHPGIIPASRGLDSFKWAILEMKAVGNTLHYIDENVDAGEIISVIPTPVYKTDSLETLARRHYENEIRMLSNFHYFLHSPINQYKENPVGEPHKRMNKETEHTVIALFNDYKAKFGV